jgi:hypothetical protein
MCVAVFAFVPATDSVLVSSFFWHDTVRWICHRIENAFWIWAEDSSFYFYPMYGHGPPAFNNPGTGATWGQRPTVIIRGNTPGKTQGINTVYLLHFDRITCSGGGFQYQQLVDGE